MSHPIGPAKDANEYIARQNNIANANEWMRFLVTHTPWAIVCPSLTFLTSLEKDIDGLAGARQMRDQFSILGRCDFLVEVGWLSPHMGDLRRIADRNHQPHIDLTFMGKSPPWALERAADVIMEHARMTSSIMPRSPWMPPLASEDILALRSAEELLVASPNHPDALAVVRTILNAAARK